MTALRRVGAGRGGEGGAAGRGTSEQGSAGRDAARRVPGAPRTRNGKRAARRAARRVATDLELEVAPARIADNELEGALADRRSTKAAATAPPRRPHRRRAQSARQELDLALGAGPGQWKGSTHALTRACTRIGAWPLKPTVQISGRRVRPFRAGWKSQPATIVFETAERRPRI